MKLPRTQKGFTLIELLVVIGIIALLASIALPAFSSVQVKAAQTKALNNAKQIGFACRTYATDNNGAYPTYAISGTTAGTTQVQSANAAFDQLIPTYLATLQPFYQPNSPETPLSRAPADPSNLSTLNGQGTPLTANLNHWAYEAGCSDTSNSSWPLICDAPANVTTPVLWAQTGPGSVWKGTKAIVVHCDDSATVDTLTTTFEDKNGPGGDDLFDNSSSTSGWLYGTGAGQSGAGQNLVPVL